jgi:hypothetical protein
MNEFLIFAIGIVVLASAALGWAAGSVTGEAQGKAQAYEKQFIEDKED